MMNRFNMSHRLCLCGKTLDLACLVLLSATFPGATLMAQADSNPLSNESTLAEKEKSLAERFDRLELLAGRLAELSKSTQPRRAEILRKLVAKSREKELPERFQAILDSLQQEQLGNASKAQTSLQTDLQAMLELLLQEDRNRQIESETKRINKYLAELNKLIRQQRGIKARTAGGDSEDALISDQKRTSDATGELGEKIAETEGTSSNDSAESSPSDGQEKSSSPSDGNSESPPAESTPSESPSSKSSPSESAPSESSPSSGEPSPGKPSDSSGKPASGSGSSSGGSPQDSEQEKQQSPSDKAVDKLKQAQQRMQQAQEQLKEAQRDKAVEKQDEALRELEQAKAELEKILRQLREEELERTLVMLEARLRKMLEAQNDIYNRTVKLDESADRAPEHEREIASATLARKEEQLVGEVDRALILLREDGSSVAFPEALQQVREDMESVANRLRSVKPDKITQAVEQDIIETLEEILTALQQALKDLRKQRTSQQQSSGGQPGDKPLVDQLAELRMIRALQTRVNRRTTYYDSLIEDHQAKDPELLEALEQLAERQEHIFEATRDLAQGANQ